MTTKQCPKCKENIQVTANKCKHCGADLRNWFKRHYIITTLLVLMVLGSFITAFSDTSTTTSSVTTNGGTTVSKPVEQAISISSTELYTQYADNEIKADDAYKSKLLQVDGNVESIGKDFLDDMYVALEGDGIIFTIQCMLKGSEKEKAINLNEGDYITVEGKNNGKLGNVLLKNCVIK